jgi:hypothetical protein
MASRLNREVEMDNTLSLLMIVQGLVPDKFGRVQKELVIIEAQQQGILEDDVLELIDVLVKNRTLKEEGDYLII